MPFTKKVFFKFSEIIIPAGIFTVWLFLYYYKLDSIPSGLYVDEASQGYNAYSILATGKDEYGMRFPILFRFLAVYTPGLYTYISILPVAIFGLSIFSVRIISALATLLSTFIVYFFLKSSRILKEKATAIITSLLFLMSPWIIIHGRYGHEVAIAFLIFSSGALFSWLGLKKNKLIILGFSILSLSTYASYSTRFLAPLLIIGYLLLFRVNFIKSKNIKYLFVSIVAALVIQIPHFTILSTPAFFVKSGLVGSEAILSQAGKVVNLVPHNIAIFLSFLREFLSQFTTYFSPRSLFFLPDPDPQRSIPGLSVFYFWMIIPYLVGIYFLWKGRTKPFSKLIFLLAILSPIPAALTRDPFSTYRAFPLLLSFILVIGIGIDRIIHSIPKRVWIPGLSLLFTFSLLLLWRSYFVLLPNERAKVWGYGFRQLASQIKSRPGEKFVIDQSRIKPAYIELAFFLKYSPEKFQKEVDQKIKENYYTDTTFNPEYNFANIETRTINWEEDIYRDQILVGDELAISKDQAKEHSLTQIFEIRDPIDQIVFQAYKTDPARKCASTSFKSVYCIDSFKTF